MRILYLHQYYCPPQGWGNDRSRHLLHHWQQAGHSVQGITSTAYFPPAMHPPRAMDTETDGISLRVHPFAYAQTMPKWAKALSFLRFGWAALWDSLQQPPPDVLVASVTPPTVGYAGYVASKLLGVPLVLEVVDVWPDVPEGMGILRHRGLLAGLHALNAKVYAHAARIVTLSPGMRDQILRHGVPPDKVVVNYNGTDPLRFRPAEPAPRPDGPVRLVYAGALGEANAVPALVAQLPRLAAATRAPFVLDIYGWGRDYAALAALCATPALQGLVRLHAPLPKAALVAVLQQADIALSSFAPFPVLEANSANKFYDYLAVGLPVALNYGGWQGQFVQAHGCGVWAPQGDWAAWVQALLPLIEGPSLRKEMGVRARQAAVAHFDRAQLAEAYLGLLLSCGAR
jgi:glycosyltransferase involved in cell wall biosynthesis